MSRSAGDSVEELKFLLDREQVCLLKTRSLLQTHMKLLQAEEATLQRLIHAQLAPPTEHTPATPTSPVMDLDLSLPGKQLPR